MRGLLVTLEATEAERDEALQHLDVMENKALEAAIAADAHQEVARVAKAERDAIFAKYPPWLEANAPASAE